MMIYIMLTKVKHWVAKKTVNVSVDNDINMCSWLRLLVIERERWSQLTVSHLMRGGHMVVTQHGRSLKYRTWSNQTDISATIRAVLFETT